MVRTVFKIARTLLQRYRLNQYDDFTIADYFRDQGAHIGANCRILIRNLGGEPYLVRIGNHCTIAGDVVFVNHDGAAWVFTEELPSLQKFGTIEILDNCFIGHGAIIMPNIRIGPNSIVGAGAVVSKHVPPDTVVAGNPAKPVCTLEEYKRKVLRTWQMQKPPGYMADLRDGVHYAPADIQKVKERYAALLRGHLQHLLWDSAYNPGFHSKQMSSPHFSSASSTGPVTRDRRHPILARGETGGSQSSE